MRERIEEIEQGKYITYTPEIEISLTNIDCKVKENERYTGSFQIKSNNEYPVTGNIYSSAFRMKCIVSEFRGAQVTLQYEFDANGTKQGNHFKGYFYLVTNAGEYTIPYSIEVENKIQPTSLGRIDNLFHFTNLAAANWEEAFQLFSAPTFRSIFTNHDRIYETLYDSLTGGQFTEQGMEEFLIGIHKKVPITITLDQPALELELTETYEKGTIEITKYGWGYLSIQANCEETFLELPKKVIHSEDFIGDKYVFEYYIRKQRLHAGKNMARIQFHTPYCSTAFEITVRKPYKKKKKGPSLFSEEKKIRLIKTYVAYQLKKISAHSWQKETRGILQELHTQGSEQLLCEMLTIQLHIAEKKVQEAKKLFHHLEVRKNEIESEPLLYGYYCYLTTLVNRSELGVEKAKEEIAALFEKYGNWQFLWFLLGLEKEYLYNNYKRMQLIERQCLHECNSPVLYLEASLILQKEPSVLVKLEKYELRLLRWMLKNQAMTKDLAIQVADLARRSKVYHKAIFQILSACFELYHDRTLLAAICSNLIKGNKMEEQYFTWYEKGVQEEIRITRLYEYYMYSLPANARPILPKPLLLYFLYQNQLDYKRKAFLYKCVILKREEYPELFFNYRKVIEKFIFEQILARHMDENIAFLYESMLSDEMLTKELAEALSETLFQYRLIVNYPDIKSVSVQHRQLVKEETYPVVKNTAYIAIYTSDYVITFIDSKGNRYTEAIAYQLDKLIHNIGLIKRCYELMEFNVLLTLFLSSEQSSFNIEDEKHLEMIYALLQSDQLKESFQLDIRKTIVRYCYDYYEKDELMPFMLEINYHLMWPQDRVRGIEYLISKGLYDKAYSIISMYGYRQLRIKKLVRVCSRQIRLQEFVKDQFLEQLAYYVLEHNKYDEVILTYLQKYFHGTIKQLFQVWNAAKRFDLDCYELEERMLRQMLFTKNLIPEGDQIFECYYKEGGSETVLRAFWSFQAYQYVAADRLISKSFFEQYDSLYETSDMCEIGEIALCKYYSTLQSRTEEQTAFVMKILPKLLQKNMYFKFFSSFEDAILTKFGLEDKMVIAYRTFADRSVRLHYSTEYQVGAEQAYMVEEMKEVYEGIYSKAFTLFFGDFLQYYITEGNFEKEHVVQSDILQKTKLNAEYIESRYHLLNDMFLSLSMTDHATLLDLMNQYAKKSFLTEQLFTVL